MKYLAVTAILSAISIIGVVEKNEDRQKEVKVQHIEFEPMFINVKR